jgi:hypothetical protein
VQLGPKWQVSHVCQQIFPTATSGLEVLVSSYTVSSYMVSASSPCTQLVSYSRGETRSVNVSVLAWMDLVSTECIWHQANASDLRMYLLSGLDVSRYWTFTFNIIPPPFWVQFGRILTSRTWWRTHLPANCTPQPQARPWLDLLALVQGFELLFFM